MLIGQYEHTIDIKKRLALPAKFRGELGEKIVITRWMESCLTVYTEKEWKIELVKSDTKTIALYIHLPFCESLCTFCGCHKRITKNHQVESPYIDAVIKEWELYKEVIDVDFQLNELHLGGGTPTFFAPNQLNRLIHAIKPSVPNGNCEMSFEAHPSSTTPAHLQVLFDLGFRRVSFGIQDYDLKDIYFLRW